MVNIVLPGLVYLKASPLPPAPLAIRRTGRTAGLEGLSRLEGLSGLMDCGMKCSRIWSPAESRTPYFGTLGHHFGSIWVPQGSILAPFGYPRVPFWDPMAPFWCPGDTHGPPMGPLGVQTRIFIDFVWILGSPWDPFWSRFSDFFVNWVTKWTALVPGSIF